MLIDSHCHLDMLEDADAALDRASTAGVTEVITIGVDLATSEDAIARATRDDRVWATVGLHPHDARTATEAMWERFHELASHERCVGVGEAGLDYHYDHSPRDVQREVFERHLGLAADAERTLVIHTREAWDDTWTTLEAGPDLTVVFHCFTGGAAEAERALALGAHLSFSGIVTFNNAVDIREAARLTPLERLVIETDSPFLAPLPYRGKPNEPAYLTQTARFLAELKGVAPEELARAATKTTRRVFSLPER